jgi:hypothetical protein
MNDFDDDDDVFDEIILRRLSPADLPEMSLDAYRRWIADVAPPTDAQIEAFADYVAGARSWYKHLALNPPGTPFQFYIDPRAGVDRLVNRSGEVHLRTRTEQTTPFHYSWMTTAEYRERFGCLAFSCAAGSALFMDDQLGDPDLLIENNCTLPAELQLADATYEPVLVDSTCYQPVLQTSCLTANSPPIEVLEAGACSLTSLVHQCANEDFLVAQLAAIKRNPYRRYDVNGSVFDSIQDRLSDLAANVNPSVETAKKASSDPVFIALIKQEKNRLRRSMIEAMQRMRQVTFQDFKPAS